MLGTCLMPPFFGLIANHITIALFPGFIAVILVLMMTMHEMMMRQFKKDESASSLN